MSLSEVIQPPSAVIGKVPNLSASTSKGGMSTTGPSGGVKLEGGKLTSCRNTSRNGSSMEMEPFVQPSVSRPMANVRLPSITPDRGLTPFLADFGSPFQSPRHSARKRPLSSTSLTSGPSIESIIRGSPSGSLFAFLGNQPGSTGRLLDTAGSRHGSMGHLTPNPVSYTHLTLPTNREV